MKNIYQLLAPLPIYLIFLFLIRKKISLLPEIFYEYYSEKLRGVFALNNKYKIAYFKFIATLGTYFILIWLYLYLIDLAYGIIGYL